MPAHRWLGGDPEHDSSAVAFNDAPVISQIISLLFDFCFPFLFFFPKIVFLIPCLCFLFPGLWFTSGQKWILRQIDGGHMIDLFNV